MITVLLFTLLACVAMLLDGRRLRKLWYRFQVWRYTHIAFKEEAIWLATKESTREMTSAGYRCWEIAEDNYCEALIKLRTYEKLLSPMVATPMDVKEKSRTK